MEMNPTCLTSPCQACCLLFARVIRFFIISKPELRGLLWAQTSLRGWQSSPATCHQLPRPAVLGDPWPVRGVPLVLGSGGAGSGAGAAPVLSLRDLLSEPGQVCPPETPPRPARLPAPAPAASSPGCPRTAAAARQGGFYTGKTGFTPAALWGLIPGWCTAHWVGQHHTRLGEINPVSRDAGSWPLQRCRMWGSPTASFILLHLGAGRGSAGHIPKAKWVLLPLLFFQAAR